MFFRELMGITKYFDLFKMTFLYKNNISIFVIKWTHLEAEILYRASSKYLNLISFVLLTKSHQTTFRIQQGVSKLLNKSKKCLLDRISGQGAFYLIKFFQTRSVLTCSKFDISKK